MMYVRVVLSMLFYTIFLLIFTPVIIILPFEGTADLGWENGLKARIAIAAYLWRKWLANILVILKPGCSRKDATVKEQHPIRR